MSFKIGDAAVHVEQLQCRGRMREIVRVTIVRETATQWIDSTGERWRKKSGWSVSRYLCPRLIVTPEEFEQNQRET